MKKPAFLKLPDALLNRYHATGELQSITAVKTDPQGRIIVTITRDGHRHTDTWLDLGGGLGYVPAAQ